ncbi:hypothetical protein WJX81_005810 [Elliptochloris bilobata]|uniref:Uncharacterized protein n=1 Tax=Elliptochloris bilobata TaxID=381761 RepID=A0AAW1R1I2_9CHLO
MDQLLCEARAVRQKRTYKLGEALAVVGTEAEAIAKATLLNAQKALVHIAFSQRATNKVRGAADAGLKSRQVRRVPKGGHDARGGQHNEPRKDEGEDEGGGCEGCWAAQSARSPMTTSARSTLKDSPAGSPCWRPSWSACARKWA